MLAQKGKSARNGAYSHSSGPPANPALDVKPSSPASSARASARTEEDDESVDLESLGTDAVSDEDLSDEGLSDSQAGDESEEPDATPRNRLGASWRPQH
jgi:hypothetical protein